MKKIIDSIPLRDQVVEIVHQMIFDGELKSNEKISERQISTMLQVSTTPVKEAFRVLQAEGFITCYPRKGSYVSGNIIEHLKQIAYLRSAIDGVAVYFAALYATKEEIKKCEAILEEAGELIRSQKSPDEISKMNDEFHSVLRNSAHNEYISNLGENIRSIDNLLRKAINKVDYKNLQDRQNEHQAILNAVRKGDSSLAEQLMIKHVRNAPIDVFDGVNR